MILVLTAGATALIVEGSLLEDPLKFALFMIGLYLTGGSANALNQYLERNIDARMVRTAHRRPLPMRQLKPRQALVFSLAIGVAGVAVMYLAFNLLTALLAAMTIVFYSLFYTVILKPTTTQNIVIGGVAGAMAPLGAWTAATGQVALIPSLMSLIIFLWTPPHFWALAMRYKDDYDAARLPMMPNIKGDAATLVSMMRYTIVLLVVSIILGIIGFGWIYMLSAATLGIIFIYKIQLARKIRKQSLDWNVFKFSIVYLFGLFGAMVLDKLVYIAIGI
jgi:protoheme IX farnesyltransferase